MWSCETLTCSKVLEGHTEAVLALAVGDLFMASGSYDTTIRWAAGLGGDVGGAEWVVGGWMDACMDGGWCMRIGTDDDGDACTHDL